MKRIPRGQLEKKWVSELEKMGPQNVRSRMSSGAVGSGDGASVKFVKIDGKTDYVTFPSRLFVENWLSEKEASSARRSDREHVLIWIAAIAGVCGVIVGLLAVAFA